MQTYVADALELGQEPLVNLRDLVDLIDRVALAECRGNSEDAAVGGSMRELEALAKTAIDEVKETGEPERLAAMNAFERKVVHDVVTSAGLVSESEGVDPDRRIVIKPAS